MQYMIAFTNSLMLHSTDGLGMNFVRHHSHILPIEYFDAACEVGIMISAEFPIAYGKPKDCDGAGPKPLGEIQTHCIPMSSILPI